MTAGSNLAPHIAYDDLREWLALAERLGEVKIVRGAEVELGALVIDSHEDVSTRSATLATLGTKSSAPESIGRIALEPNRSRARYRHLATNNALAG